MLAKNYRLTKRRDFEQVFKYGKKLSNGYFFIRFNKNSLDHPRFTVVVPNKISKSAVKRNRIKRQVREIIKNKIIEKVHNQDVIVNVLSKSLNNNYEFLEEQLLSIFKKCKLI